MAYKKVPSFSSIIKHIEERDKNKPAERRFENVYYYISPVGREGLNKALEDYKKDKKL